MIVPDRWSYPEETIHIDTIYPRFKLFRASQGKKELDWYTNPVGDYRKYELKTKI